jgi:hypothetical protein
MALSFAQLSLFILSQAQAFPKVSRIGDVYPVAEEDALAEIERRAGAASVGIEDFGDSDGWTATGGVALPLGQEASVRLITPLHTLDFEIPHPEGGILYPEGFTFNPLAYGKLPGRILVTTPDRLDWARGEAAPADMILLSGGNALKATIRVGESIFRLEPGLAERLGLRSVPSIVRQEGVQLEVTELKADDVPPDEEIARRAAAAATDTGGAQ